MTALVLLDEPEWFLVPAVDKSLHSSALPLLENTKLEISGDSVPIPLKPLTLLLQFPPLPTLILVSVIEH